MPAGNHIRWAISAAAIIPIILPTAYILYLNRTVSKQTSSSTGRRSRSGGDKDTAAASSPTPWLPASLPEDVRPVDSDWVLAFERVVSRPVPVSSLIRPPNASPSESSSPSDLLKLYSQAAQIAFSWTPQAFAIRASIREPGLKRTFDEDVIKSLEFRSGDIANGVYKVTYSGQGETSAAERVELALEAPKSYKGPVPRGLIVSEIQVVGPSGTVSQGDGDHVVFVNETWMWRRDTEPPTLIEGSVGGWLHTILAGWLALKGMRAVAPKEIV